MAHTCEFSFDGTVLLTEADIWPDGDAPENWTAHDVRTLLVGKWVGAWNLEDVIQCTLIDDSGNIEYEIPTSVGGR